MTRLIACICVFTLLVVSVLPEQLPLAGTPQTAVQDSAVLKAQADSALANSQYKVVKKDLVVSDQVKIGTSIMVFVILVMSFFKNFNPDRI